MKLSYTFFIIQFFLISTINSQTIHEADLSLKINNIKNDNGHIALLIFKTEEGFPADHNNAFLMKRFAIKSENEPYHIENLPAGNYAISIVHDENGNDQLDTNLFGIPKEGYAVSNNAPAQMFGPPLFSEAEFIHSENGSFLNLIIQY